MSVIQIVKQGLLGEGTSQNWILCKQKVSSVPKLFENIDPARLTAGTVMAPMEILESLGLGQDGFNVMSIEVQNMIEEDLGKHISQVSLRDVFKYFRKIRIREEKNKEDYKMNQLIKAAIDFYQAQRTEALAHLDILFNDATAIGEHTDLLAEVKKWTENLASAEDCLETLRRNFEVK